MVSGTPPCTTLHRTLILQFTTMIIMSNSNVEHQNHHPWHQHFSASGCVPILTWQDQDQVVFKIKYEPDSGWVEVVGHQVGNCFSCRSRDLDCVLNAFSTFLECVFLNVFLTFLQCVFLNVFSTFLQCVFLKWLFDFSPVCLFKCLFDFSTWIAVKIVFYRTQVNLGSDLWVRMSLTN